MGDPGFQSLTHSDQLGKLEELQVNGNAITRIGVEFFSASPNLSALKKLDLRRNKFKMEDVLFLQDSPRFKKIETLKF
jgi:hypothetical protein